jgi:hypothetical protein|tara:strand:+ start:853 stop:1137 length:285 start_codon:yes stop_codon:yes gene_type:complete
MIETIIVYLLFPLAIISTAVLLWYIRKLLDTIEDNSLEMKERFNAFHEFLDETYKMDLFHGEPRLKELLSIIKDFDEWASEFEERTITEKENND